MSDEEQDWSETEREFALDLARADDYSALEEFLAGVYADEDDDAARRAVNVRRLLVVLTRIEGATTATTTWRSAAKISDSALRNLEDAATVVELQAMRGAMRGEAVRVDDPSPAFEPALTITEAAYLYVMVEMGWSPEDIARRRGLESGRAVRDTLKTARQKLGCRSNAQAGLWAYKRGEFAYWREYPKPRRARNRSKEERQREWWDAEIEKERRRMRKDGDFKLRGLRSGSEAKAYNHPASDPDARKPKAIHVETEPSREVEWDGVAEERDEYQVALNQAEKKS